MVQGFGADMLIRSLIRSGLLNLIWMGCSNFVSNDGKCITVNCTKE